MTIAENSLFVRFFLTIWLGLKQAFPESGIGRWCGALSGWAYRQASGSVICRFVWREGRLPMAWPNSLACRCVTGLVNIPCTIVKTIWKAGEPVWQDSLVCRALTTLGGGTFFFLGLFMLVMLAAPHETWNNLYGLLGAVGLTALFILGSASRQRSRLEVDALGPYMFFYGCLIILAAAGSASTGLSLRFLLFHITSLLLVLVVVSGVRSYEQLQLTVALAVLGVSIAAVYGCYQGYKGVEVIASLQDMTVNEGMPGRVYSFFDNPNNFAELLTMLLPLDLALFLNAHWRGKILSLLSLCFGVAALGMTYGRSCWIGAALAVVVFLALMDWRWVPVLILAGIAALPFLPTSIYNRILTITNTKDSSVQYRFEIYSTSWNLLKDNWIKGVGLGSDVTHRAFTLGAYPSISDGNYPLHCHNNYMQMWLETGIWGILSFLGLLLWQLKQGVKAFRQSMDPRVKRMLAASIGAFCGIMVVSVAEYTWYYPRNMFTYWFLFGVIAACVKLVKLEQKQK